MYRKSLGLLQKLNPHNSWTFLIPLAGISLFALFLCGCKGQSHHTPTPVVSPSIIDSVPHDITAFTQGLLIDGHVWLESTGRYGHSALREVERTTGEVLRNVPLPDRLFGEGLALFEGKLYQLTWREGLCLLYDRASLEIVGHFRYEGEGWGLTNCEDWLYMSNGSNTIQVRDPASFQVVRSIAVYDQDNEIANLNELAWIEGEIWANIFKIKKIVRIDPATGRVLGFLEFNHLPLPGDEHPRQDVFNGIAYDPEDQSIWVTGKKWSRLYRIQWPMQDN